MTQTELAPLIDADQAMAALRDVALGERDASSFRCADDDYPLERLRLAYLDSDLTVNERAVRLRHALRFAATGLEAGGSARTLPLFPEGRELSRDDLNAFGLQRRATGEIDARPWEPQWLRGSRERPADEAAMRGERRRWINREPEADPWVRKHFGIPTYRGPGQALAVRAALHMDAGTTIVVVLPTGEGKSLVFHTLAAAHPGKTIAVVVPTVALALDQHMVLAERDPTISRHHAYVGGSNNAERNEAIVSRVREGKQPLLFAAPEAFVSSLREPLLQSARAGRLAALVIDEAHLVDAWGTEFRNEFQLLGALVAELRAEASADAAPRVVCLSGTLNQTAFETLRALFPSEAPMERVSLVAAARLRPESDIWIAEPCESPAARAERVLEALRFLPRPAILYVTRVDDANEWRARLAVAGFLRVGVVHGKTPSHERERVLERWRKGELDLVVGTSAFGLGIDFAHVRAVVHACVPESIDRYYQEIGRAGRDNRSAIALIVPARTDFPMAESLSSKKVISEELGLARWRAMFFGADARRGDGVHRILVDVGTSPAYEPDMRSDRNENWNCNVLNLMVRAGIIRYAGLARRADDGQTLLAVDICDERHLEDTLWSERIGPLRARLKAADRRGYEAIERLLRGTNCPSTSFAQMYELEDDGVTFAVTRACGGCRACRAASPGWFADWPSPPRTALTIGKLNVPLAALASRGGQLYVEVPRDAAATPRFDRLSGEFMDALWRHGLRKFILLGEGTARVRDALESRPWCVAAGRESSLLEANGLPPGPDAVWISDLDSMPLSQFAPRPKGRERVLVAPEDIADPRYSGSTVSERMIPTRFEDLLERLDR